MDRWLRAEKFKHFYDVIEVAKFSKFFVPQESVRKILPYLRMVKQDGFAYCNALLRLLLGHVFMKLLLRQ